MQADVPTGAPLVVRETFNDMMSHKITHAEAFAKLSDSILVGAAVAQKNVKFELGTDGGFQTFLQSELQKQSRGTFAVTTNAARLTMFAANR